MASSTDDLPCILSGTAGHSREGTLPILLSRPLLVLQRAETVQLAGCPTVLPPTPPSRTGRQRLFLSGRKLGVLRESPLRLVEMNSRLAGWVFILTRPPRYNWADSEHSPTAPVALDAQ